MVRDWPKVALSILGMAGLLFAIFTVGRILLTFDLFDFNIYYRASQDIRSHILLYHNHSIDNNYPPSAFLFTLPVSYLPQAVAENVWTLVSVALLVVSIWGYSQAVVPGKVSKLVVGVAALAIFSFPVKFTLGLGQINFLILALVAGAFAAFQRDNPRLAGILIGMAAAIKITPLVLVLYFWRKRSFQVGWWSMSSFVCLQLIAACLVGWPTMVEYYTQVFPHIPTVGNASYYNQAVTGLLARAQLPNFWAALINYGLLVGLLGLLWRSTSPKKGQSATELVEYGLFILVTLLCAGLAWQHHFVWTLPLFIGLLAIQWQSQKVFRWILLFFSYLLIGWNIHQPWAFVGLASLLLSHVCFGGMLLFSLALITLRRLPPDTSH